MQMFGEQKIDVENIDCGGGGISMRVGFFFFFFLEIERRNIRDSVDR